MTVKWGSCICLLGLLALSAGCRTPPPNLKPEKTPEMLTPPPNDARFDTPDLPKQALEGKDRTKQYTVDDKAPGMNPQDSPGKGGGMGPGGH